MSTTKALYHKLCDDLDGQPSGSPAMSFAAQALKSKIFKKLVVAEDAAAHDRAIQKFLDCNDMCRVYRLVRSPLLQRARSIIYSMFPYADDVDARISELGMHGNGSSAGLKDTSFLTKEGTFMTYTHTGVLTEYVRAHKTDWTSFFAATKLLSARRHRSVIPKVTTVPKYNHIRRTICSEASCNMFMQRGLGRYIDECVRNRFGFDPVVQQDRNRQFALEGSAKGTYGTIDLESASDLVSLRLCAYLFPPHIFLRLCFYRSKYVMVGGQKVKLYMLSSMGNGFTFSVETAVFSALCAAAYSLLGMAFNHRTAGVFGDDIVVREPAYQLCFTALEHAGAVVNRSKSFNDGAFRESCGGDFFAGVDVRPVYIKSLSSESDVYKAFNLLAGWSARLGIKLETTLTFLLRSAPRRYVPLHESVDSGFRVPLGIAKPKLIRWCFTYQALCTKVRRVRAERLSRNKHAQLLAFLHGSIRDGSITLRGHLDPHAYSQRTLFTSSWDYIEPGDRSLRNVSVYWLTWALDRGGSDPS